MRAMSLLKQDKITIDDSKVVKLRLALSIAIFIVWSVIIIVFISILATFFFYKINIKKISKKLK